MSSPGIAQGRPEYSRCTCMLVCIFFMRKQTEKPRRTGSPPEPVIGRAFARPGGGDDEGVLPRYPSRHWTSPAGQDHLSAYGTRTPNPRNRSAGLDFRQPNSLLVT